MYDFTVFINSGGPNVTKENISDTIKSIYFKSGTDNLCFYYVCDSENIKNMILEVFEKLNLNGKLEKLIVNNDSWAKNYNIFYKEYCEKSKFLVYSHDDLEIRTDNYFKILEDIYYRSKEKIGWISFTSDAYYKIYNRQIHNSVREGFCIDRNNYPRTFELAGNEINLPSGPIKCHATFPHLVFINSEVMKDIGDCSDWSQYTLLIDEDWGLRALEKNYFNIWIPNIFYTHPLRAFERKYQGLRFEGQVHKHFLDKWGWNFSHGNYSDSFINQICDKYKIQTYH